MTALSAWPALVLAAGLGTRLRPLSDVRAKAALPIGDDVLVRRILAWLAAAGVRRVVVNLHHLPQTLTPHVGDGRDLGLDVRYSWEPAILGSAGGPRHALPLLDAPRFLIVNGDTITDVDIGELAATHVETRAAVTMAVTAGRPGYGGVDVADDGCVRGFPPRSQAGAPQQEHAHFVGVQAVEREVFAPLTDGAAAESVGWLYPRLIAAQPGSVRAHRSQASFHDIGTPASYQATVLGLVGPGPHVGRRVSIAPSARVAGSILWDDVRVGPDAEVVDCIVADGVHVPAGARCHGQALVAVNGTFEAVPIAPAGVDRRLPRGCEGFPD